MDFGSILHQAQKNDKGGQNRPNFYKTKFDPPKKEIKTKNLSANIQKFLAKKEEEEKYKQDIAKRKHEELVAMRDEKTKNKIKKSLKVIKSANKSVLDDAVDNVNTALTLAGPDQPDEDDYGYVSQEASAFYSKMMEKYKSVPDEEKFKSAKKHVNHDLSGTKDRVKAAILRHHEEELLPHKRKRRSHASNDQTAEIDNSNYDDESYEEKKEQKPEKPKPRKMAPPPIDFNELLKLAEKKQFEPIVEETKKPEPVEEPERLMTKKQRREYEQYKAYKEAKLRREQERDNRDRREGSSRPESSSRSEISSRSETSSNLSTGRIPKLSDSRKSSTINGHSDVNRSSNSKRDNDYSDSKYKKEEQRVPQKNFNSSEDRRIPKISSSSKSNSQDDRLSRPSEKSFKIPKASNGSTTNLKEAVKNPPGRNEAHLSDKYSKSSNSVSSSKSSSIHDRKYTPKTIETKKPEFRKPERPDDRKKLESQKQGVRLNQSEPNRSINKSSNSVVDRNSQGKPFGNVVKLSNPSADLQNKKLPISRNDRGGEFKPQPSNVKQGIKQSVDPKHTKPGDFRSDARSIRPQSSDKGPARPMASGSSKNSKPPLSTSMRPLPASDVKGSRPMNSANNGVRPGTTTNNKPSRPITPSDVKGSKQLPPSDVRGARQLPPSDVRGARQLPPSDVRGARQLPPSDVRGARQLPPSDVKGGRQFPPSDVKGGRQFPPSDVKGGRQFPPSDVKGGRQFPPSDVKGGRQFPPSDVRGPRQFPPRDTMSRNDRRPVKRRIDDDSEYDSELDDFIDDGPQDGNDYSKYIKEIFGYDKSRYKDDDADVDNMESNFSQVMKEEFLSKKIGLMEDLEDMRMEAEEKKRKMQRKRRRIDDSDDD